MFQQPPAALLADPHPGLPGVAGGGALPAVHVLSGQEVETSGDASRPAKSWGHPLLKLPLWATYSAGRSRGLGLESTSRIEISDWDFETLDLERTRGMHFTSVPRRKKLWHCSGREDPHAKNDTYLFLTEKEKVSSEVAREKNYHNFCASLIY